jgi:hypothetical protein
LGLELNDAVNKDAVDGRVTNVAVVDDDSEIDATELLPSSTAGSDCWVECGGNNNVPVD